MIVALSTVIVADREDVEVFSDTYTVTVASFEPDDELNVHQVWSLVIVQLTLEVIVKLSLPPVAVNDRLFLFS